MAEPISIQQLKDASEDAISLAEFINKPENVMIPRRLASDIHSLQYYLEYMKSFAQRSYETYDEMVSNANNLSENVSVFVTNDLDSSKNGIYTYNGTSFVKGEYQPENAAKEFVEAKIDALPFEDGTLADTFVVVDGNQNQRDVNQKTARKYISVAAMIADDKLKVGRYVSTLGYYEAGDGGGNDYLIVAASTGTSDGGSLIDLANGLQAKATFVNAHPNAMQFGAKGHDKTLDSQPRLQAYIKWCEINGFSSGYIPTFKQTYKLNAPLVLELGDFRLFGDKGMQYNHPWVDTSIPRDWRKGNFVVSENVRCAIDLGASQRSGANVTPETPQTKNFAQAWTVNGLSVVGEKGAYNRTSDGIQWTATQNGPHRPVVLNGLSAYGVSRAFYVEPLAPDTTIQMANLQISDCTFSFCDYAIFTEGAGIYGANIHDNNFEANGKGCIKGNFNGYVAIKNNMLENTKNPVDIHVSSAEVVTEGNYFEYHPTSDFLYSFTATSAYSTATLRLGADIYSGGIPKYTLSLKGKGGFRVIAKNNTLVSAIDGDIVLANETTLFEEGKTISVKSDFLANDGKYGHLTFNNKSLILSHNSDIANAESGYKFTTPNIADEGTFIEPSPFGDIYVRDFADSFQVVFDGLVADKFIEINMLVRVKNKIYNEGAPTGMSATTGIKGTGSYVTGHVRGGDHIWQAVGELGGWQVVTMVGVQVGGINQFWSNLPEDKRGSFLCGGVATKILGNAKDINGNGIIYTGIKGYLPKVNNAVVARESFTAELIPEAPIEAGTTYSKNFTVPFVGKSTPVAVTHSHVLNGMHIWAVNELQGVVTVYIHNPTTSAKTIGSGNVVIYKL